MNLTKHMSSIRTLATLGFCLVMGTSTLAAQVVCGDIITKPTKLTAKLTCVDDAGPAVLTVMGPGGKLNLNGFTVDCNNDDDATDSDGILLTGRKARVHSGTVIDCIDGVDVGDAGNHQVSNVTSENNSLAGFRITSDDNSLVDNTAFQNTQDGFAVSGNDNHLTANLADDNGFEGFDVSGGDGNVLTGNTPRYNNLRGLDCLGGATDTVLAGNQFLDNRGVPAQVWLRGACDRTRMNTNTVDGNDGDFVGIQVQSDDNRFEGNIVTDAATGIYVFGGSTGNRIEGNDVTGNTLDMRDDNANYDNNKWKGNVFNTSSQGCIN